MVLSINIKQLPKLFIHYIFSKQKLKILIFKYLFVVGHDYSFTYWNKSMQYRIKENYITLSNNLHPIRTNVLDNF